MNTSSTPKTQYGYASGSANTIRPTSQTYPNGRVLTFSYGTTGSSNEDESRTSALVDSRPGRVARRGDGIWIISGMVYRSLDGRD